MRSRRLTAVAVLAAGLAAVGGPARATPDPDECSAENFNACLNGVASAVTSLDSARVSGTRIGALGRESQEGEKHAGLGTAGLSAGDTFSGFNVWASWLRSDFESTVAVAPYDAELDNVLVGIDRLVGERGVLGIAAGVESVETTTRFNGGGQDATGYTIAPYALYVFSDSVNIDASLGYTYIDTDQNRISTVDGSTITSDFTSNRVFATTNLNGLWIRDKVVVGARVGLLYTEETQDAYNERGATGTRNVKRRDLDLIQAYIGGEVGYSAGAWEPYALASYHYDVTREDGSNAGGLPGNVGSTTPDDDDELRAGVGIRYFGDGVSGSLELQKTFGRAKFDEHSVNLTVRFEL